MLPINCKLIKSLIEGGILLCFKEDTTFEFQPLWYENCELNYFETSKYRVQGAFLKIRRLDRRVDSLAGACFDIQDSV